MDLPQNDGKGKRFSQLCRLCAEINEEMIEIFSKEGHDKKLADKINYSLPITVTDMDHLPNKACLRCILWLDMVYDMQQNCKEADEFLRSMFGENTQEQSINQPWVSYGHPSYSECGMETQTAPPKEDYHTVEPSDMNTMQENSQDSPEDLSTTLLTVEKPKPNAQKILKSEDEEKPQQCAHCEVQVDNVDEFCSRTTVTCSNSKCSFSTNPQEEKEKAEKQLSTPLVTDTVKQKLTTKTSNIDKENTKEKKKRGRKKSIEPKQKRVNIKKCYKCYRCNEKFALEDRVGYKNHLKEHIASKGEKPKNVITKCDYCDLLFIDDSAKTRHMIQKHQEYYVPYICDICGSRFKSKTAMKLHINGRHNNERKCLCETCGKAFNTKTDLRNHNKTHIQITVECPVCSKKVLSHRLRNHMVRHSGRTFTCSVCSAEFYTNEKLNQHMEIHLNKSYECEICSCTYNRKTNLTEHKKRHKDPDTGNYVCLIQYCKKQFANENGLIMHCNEHTKEELLSNKPFKDPVIKKSPTAFYCCYCDKCIRHLTIYINHMKKHHKDDSRNGIKLACSICDIQFGSSIEFTDHLMSHQEAYTFACDFCKDSFVSYEMKMTHVNSLHKDFFQCNVCSETFDSKKSLKDHKLSNHTEDRKFQCSYCEKGFTQKRYLDSHITIHTGERNYICQVCSRTFRVKGDLNVHMTTHSKVKAHKCTKCDFSCKRRCELLQHLAKKHPETTYSDHE